MRHLRRALIVIFALAAAAHGQSFEPQNRHAIENGEGYETTTRPYLARVPYTLKWHASKTYKLYGKEDPSVKYPVGKVSIHVLDESGSIIARVSDGPLDGELRINRTGKHRVHVFTLGTWDTWYVEDEAALKEWARRQRDGEPHPNAPSALGSASAGEETIPGLSAKMIAEIEDGRSSLNRDSPHWIADNAELDQQIKLVKIAAGKASSVEEFRRLCAAMLPSRQERPASSAAAAQPAPQVPAVTGELEPLVIEDQ